MILEVKAEFEANKNFKGLALEIEERMFDNKIVIRVFAPGTQYVCEAVAHRDGWVSEVNVRDMIFRMASDCARKLCLQQGPAMAAELVKTRDELDRYKEAVRSLSFQLEMNKTPVAALVSEARIRELALEQAAEFLMDHGIVTTGAELESVCEQMKKLRREDAMRQLPVGMPEAVKKAAKEQFFPLGVPPWMR
jgi:hypothetical protein